MHTEEMLTTSPTTSYSHLKNGLPKFIILPLNSKLFLLEKIILLMLIKGPSTTLKII